MSCLIHLSWIFVGSFVPLQIKNEAISFVLQIIKLI